MGLLFSKKKTTLNNQTTVNTQTTVNPNINIENDFTQAGEAVSTVIADSTAELGRSLNKGVKAATAIALLFAVGSAL